MKLFKFASLLLGASLVGLGGAMVITNPGQEAYEDYATQQLTLYLETRSDEICQDTPGFLQDLLQDQCGTLLRSLLDSNQNQVRQIISRSTERQNFYVLSIYKTNLQIHDMLPSYYVESVGVFQNFYIYTAEQR
ncbi:MAG: DUF4359 domain-containing protein [Synechococcales cyanobacterium K44_A2020_017]|jgi:hypothetical protein|uniref:DUF4359 domain-containing protein n=1 Tax=Leptolyngbya sp. CCY15150 TaxID=2767772 RepID=UPI001950B105|nr:DUF4359 domain-containing protein [Leptolyngbya sp. CCY15150]MBF2088231.1 DUF4359 domain-containing protein [Synechococcales cyanobacterium K32_A2020_035]MBF2095307.1 DUF4359 domain-containing protein [Synechococcales cyanobacterium K44_A2020_017]